MPMNKQVDIQFTEHLRQSADRALAELKYNPGDFRQMLANEGGYQTALRLLAPGRPVSDGFTKLLFAKRLDLSVEAIALQPRWSKYFSEEYLAEARKRLRAVNFDFASISAELSDVSVADVIDWTVEEVRATVNDYFQMLRAESNGIAYNKSRHNEELRKKLHNRSKGSVEFKHQNISAVLNEKGLPYIAGYKPRSNYQELLRNEVEQYLADYAELTDQILAAFEAVPPKRAVTKRYDEYVQDPPQVSDKEIKEPTFTPKKGIPSELARRDSVNKALGDAGESFIFDIECERLRSLGRPDLAESVVWVSRDKGDGAGYDILSHEMDGTPRYIEVKTTNGGAMTPFLLSKNEFEFAKRHQKIFHVYRVYSFGRERKLYVLTFPVDSSATIEPASYRVSF